MLAPDDARSRRRSLPEVTAQIILEGLPVADDEAVEEGEQVMGVIGTAEVLPSADARPVF